MILRVKTKRAKVISCILVFSLGGILLFFNVRVFWADVNYRRGRAYDEEMFWDEAVVNYQKAIRLDSGNALYHNKLGEIYFRMARFREDKEFYYQKAISEYLIAIKLNPLDAFSYSDLGWTYLWMGDTGEAIHYFKEAIERDPNNAFFHVSLGSAYRKSGKLDEAKAEYEKALRILPDQSQVRQALEEINAQIIN